jgi:proline iminopeptidase
MSKPSEIRVRELFVRVGRARLFVRDAGHGLPIIVLHGGPDFDHEYLLPDLDRLAERFRLVYYDQRGRGRSFSGEGPSEVTLASEMEDLDRVREWTGSDSVTVLGHSWGGVLAMEYAIRHAARVSSLILMNTAPASHADMLLLRREMAAQRSPSANERLDQLRSEEAYQRGDLSADAEYHHIHFGTSFRRPGQLDALIGRLRASFTEQGIAAARAIEDALYAQTWSREDYDLIPQLQALRVPTLVIHGEHDFIPLDIPRRIAAAIPGSRLVVLPKAGHFSYIDQPERLFATITEFLTRAAL